MKTEMGVFKCVHSSVSVCVFGGGIAIAGITVSKGSTVKYVHHVLI